MISYEQKEKKFNFRVGGILESPDRKNVLIHRLSNFNLEKECKKRNIEHCTKSKQYDQLKAKF